MESSDFRIDDMDPDELFTLAVDLGDAGEYDKGLECLDKLIERGIESTTVYVKAGYYLWEMNRLSEAAECFTKAVHRSPTYEWASVGLFHVLWDAGKEGEAFEEAKRFVLMGGEMKEYKLLLRELEECMDENTEDDETK